MRTQFLCHELDLLNIQYFREPFMNIVTIHSESIPEKIAEKYDLVPQQHNENNNRNTRAGFNRASTFRGATNRGNKRAQAPRGN